MPFALAIDLVFSRDDGVSGQGDAGLLTGLKDVVMRGPLSIINMCIGLRIDEDATHPVKVAEAKVFGSHDGRQDTPRSARLVAGSSGSAKGLLIVLLCLG